MLLNRTILCLCFLYIAILEGVYSVDELEVEEAKCNLAISRPCRSNSSLCVLHEHVQDGFVDCPDGSDEDCGEGWFICEDFTGCVSPERIQDGHADCHDESDEACNEDQHECLCGFPRCIDKSKVMDGKLDCVEGSDELTIMKDSYICPDDLATNQELSRDKRHTQDMKPRKMKNSGVTTNYYEIKKGVTLPVGVLTSTVDSFVNKGTTSEYFTKVTGKSTDGKYAQVTSHISRTFFALPTRLNRGQVHGLVSSVIKTLISNGFTQTLVSRIYHTDIDGSYAQLVETETKGLGVTPTATNYITILQGEELHGTFLSHPEESLATIKFSHLEGSLNPDPVAGEIVTVTGTHGQFIRDGHDKQTTFGVFTGSYVKDDRTYVFFFGNSALPSGSMPGHMDKLVMKQGNERGNVILDMEKDMEFIMPSKLKAMDMASKENLFIGEGMVDGHKVDGVFIADSEGIDIKGAHKESGGDIKMLTVTIGQPSTIMDKSHMTTQVFDAFDMLGQKDEGNFNNLVQNEIELSALKGRKVDANENEITFDFIQPSRPQPAVPTFVISEPQQDIAELLRREMDERQTFFTPQLPKNDNDESSILRDIKAKFNIDSDFVESNYQTVTYYGFAEFTTTIADTVVVFSPTSGIPPIHKAVSNTLTGRIAPSINSEIQNSNLIAPTQTIPDYSTVSTKVFNTVDLYPSGLVSSIGGTIINDDMTTLFTTLVLGTYIDGQYAQVVRSTSSIFYLVPQSVSASVQPTNVFPELHVTPTPFEPATELPVEEAVISPEEGDIFDSFFKDITDNTIGRAVSGDSTDQKIVNENIEKEMDKTVFPKKKSQYNTYTIYTTYVNDGFTTVSTEYRTALAEKPSIITKQPSLSTLTHFTTEFTKGTTIVSSSIEIIQTTSPITTTNAFFNLFSLIENDSPIDTESVTERYEEETSEATTESSTQESTELPVTHLESSLNPDDVVKTVFFPRTYYTTYTYFTTYYRQGTSSIVSSLETVTNVVTNTNEVGDHQELRPIVSNQPITYYTTFTYWSTIVRGNSSITSSSKQTISNVVSLSDENQAVTPVPVLPIATTISPLDSFPISDKNPQDNEVANAFTTYYTTFTHFTTLFNDGTTLVTSVLETSSSIATGTIIPAQVNTLIKTTSNTGESLFDDILFDSDSESALTTPDPIFEESLDELNLFGIFNTKEETATSKTGLLSTIRRSTIIDDTTTIFSTNVYGSYVNGLYVQIQSTTSEILQPAHLESLVPKSAVKDEKVNVLTVNAGTIIENQVTTYYTTQVLQTFIGGQYVEKVRSTSRFEGMTDSSVETNPTQTGTVREIVGSIIHGTKTTYYHSTVLGTLVGGIYAQKVESTSRLVSGPSLTFEPIPVIEDISKPVSNIRTEPLEPSTDSQIQPTSTETVTEALEDKVEKTNIGKNRLSFPIRISSKRRTGLFNFIKRTSTFERPDVKTKGIIAPVLARDEVTEIISLPEKEKTTTTKPTTPKPRKSPFRFGSSGGSKTRSIFRFKPKSESPKREEKPNHKIKDFQKKEEKQIKPKPPPVPSPKRPKKPEAKEAKQPKQDKTPEQPFSQFRFRSKSSKDSGTRSSLPFPARKRTPSSSKNKSFKFLQESNDDIQPPPTTTTTTKPPPRKSTKAKQRPFSFLNRPSPRDRPARARPNRASRLQSRRRSILSRLHREESILEPVYILPEDYSTSYGDPELDVIPFTVEDVLSRKKRESTFGARTSRGSKRFTRNQAPASETEDTNRAPPQKSPTRRGARVRVRPKFARAEESKAAKPRQESATRKRTARVSSGRKLTSRSKTGSKSRNTLPFRTRASRRLNTPSRTPPQRGFRRPSTTNRLKVSNRFNTKPKDTTPPDTKRRPSAFLSNRGRVDHREMLRQKAAERAKQEEKERLALEQAKLEQEKKEEPVQISSEVTVTRDVPVTTAIPLIEDGNTVTKQVITASKLVQVIPSSLITPTQIDGEIKYLLSSSVGKMKLTQLFIEPSIKEHIVYSSAFVSGRQTSTPQIVPSTVYNVVTVTTTKADNDIGDLLKLLVLQQQQQNPLLAALGLNQPSTTVSVLTSVYETTVINEVSAVVPIILRGKAVEKTIVDTQTQVVTTTDFVTQTVTLGNSNPLGLTNPLLPLLIHNQRAIRSTKNERIQRSVKAEDYSNIDENIQEDTFNYQIEPTFNEVETKKIHDLTPVLEIVPKKIADLKHENLYAENKSIQNNEKHFLLKRPAEFAPLKRKVRSAQRGRFNRQRGRRRFLAGRKVQDGAKQQVLDEDKKFLPTIAPIDTVPVTYYTTFTFYTTYKDDAGKEFVQSSEETITQIATHGQVQFVDLTRTSLPVVDKTEIPIQEKFHLQDAIIPGKPRPVPDPIFKDPQPPHGPIVRHETPQRSAPQRVVRIRPQFNPNLRRQRTQVELVQPITVLPHHRIKKINSPDILDIEPQDSILEQKDLKRVRVTVTKKRPISSNVADVVDKSTINDGGKPRVIITRRLPHPQPTAVASPIDPFMGSVDTLYTVYSYLYSVYEGPVPLSVSTRLITVSNSIEPTLVKVPHQYQSVDIQSNFYTIEKGKSTVKLGVRATTGYATEIFLASATLAEIRPDSSTPLKAEQTTTLISGIPEIKNSEFIGTHLESSLVEPENIRVQATPSVSLQSESISALQVTTGRKQRLTNKLKDTVSKAKRIIPTNRGTSKFTTTKADLSLNTRRRTVRPTTRKLTPSRSRKRQRRPRPTPPLEQNLEKDVTKVDLLDPFREEEKTALEDLEKSVFQEDDHTTPSSEDSFSLFDLFDTTEKEPIIEEEIAKEENTPVSSDILSIFETQHPEVQQSHETTALKTTASPTTTPRTTRKPLRRDDIPIRRSKPGRTPNLTPKDFTLRFTTTLKPQDEIIEQPPTTTTEASAPEEYQAEEYDYYHEYAYDDYPSTQSKPANNSDNYSFTQIQPSEVSEKDEASYTTFTTSTLLPILGGEQSLTLTVVTSTLVSLTDYIPATVTQENTKTDTARNLDDFFAAVIPDEVISSKTAIPIVQNSLEAKGRAVHADGDSFQGLGAIITTGLRQNLATKVMDNGVHVIVADGATPLFHATLKDTDMFKGEDFGEAITLAPSTLSHKMVLVNSNSEDPNAFSTKETVYQLNTYFTTFTYYKTLLVSGRPLVVSSIETSSNIESSTIELFGNFIEKTKVQLDTQTYLTTHTFVKTLDALNEPKTVTSEEVVTQIVVTESPDVMRTKVTPTHTFFETKTYFTTFTYYSTYADGPDTFVDSSTAVSSQVVVDTSKVIGTLPPISVTDISHQLESSRPVQYLATKTYYTTSTYLTTILEGGSTVTSSRMEITSNIVTEPYTSIGNFVFPTESDSDIKLSTKEYENIAYIPLGDNKYKELRTLFATYTHFTTFTNGAVESREVTKTQVLTSMISTTTVPASLILDKSAHVVESTASFLPDIKSTVVMLDPSFMATSTVNVPTDSLDSSKVMLIKGSSKPIKISDPKATMHVSKGSESGTKVVQDSLTEATLLVGSSTDSPSSVRFDFVDAFISDAIQSTDILASSELPLIETTNVVSPISTHDISTSTLDHPTILKNEAGVESALGIGDMVIIITKPSGQVVTLPHPKLEATQTLDELLSDLTRRPDSQTGISDQDSFDSPPVRIGISSSSSGSSTSSISSGGGGSVTGDSSSGDGVSALTLGLAPMLTAVAGILGNSLVGSLTSGGSPGVRRKADQPLLPKNTIVSAEQEPLFIPVGGVGASLSSYEQSTVVPEHGFIPLSRPDAHGERHQFQGNFRVSPQLPTHPDSGDRRDFIASMERFGPTFRPPQTTEAGFTAMTRGFSPTQVSIISGEQTIFFGDQTNKEISVSGRPVRLGTESFTSEVRPVPIPTKISTETHEEPKQPSEGQGSNVFDFFDFIYPTANPQEDYVNPAVDPQDIEYKVESPLDTIHDYLSYDDLLPHEILQNSEIIDPSADLIGPTVIFDPSFTSHFPSGKSDSGITSVLTGSDGSTTHLITKTKMNHVVKETKTFYKHPESTMILSTEVIKKTVPVRILVTTIVGHTTRINEVKPTNTFGGILPTKQLEDEHINPLFPDYPEVQPNEANLGYDEENEISRFIESNSPDQDLRQLHKTTTCTLQCSKNEICKVEGEIEACTCKPGYSRKQDDQPCIKTTAYQVDVILEKFSDTELVFSPEMKDKTHPNTQFLMKEVGSGVEKTLIESNIGDNYHSNVVLEFDEVPRGQESRLVVAKVKVDVTDGTAAGNAFLGASFFTPKIKVDQSSLKLAMEESLGNSNYSLGGSDLFVKKESAILASKDFNECQSPEHNDCHEDAICINIIGSFTCKCNKHFKDQSDTSEPGRHCVEHKTCADCNYHGRCLEAANGRTSCQCDDWFSGERCQINMKVMLIAVVTVGAFLLLLLVIFLSFCCCRTRKDKQSAFLRPKNVGVPSTLDRRAMIHDSSSESSEDISRIPSASMDVKVHSLHKLQPTFTTDRKSSRASSHDRSVGVHGSIPPVLIPRVKGYPAPVPKRSLGLDFNNGSFIPEETKEKMKASPQAVLVDLLEGPVNREESKDRISMAKSASVHSIGDSNKYMPSKSRSREELHHEIAHHFRRHHHHQQHHPHEEPITPVEAIRPSSRRRYHHHEDKEVFRSRSSDRLDRSTQDLSSEFGASSLQFGNKTVSEVRSFDETTVRPPIRSLRGESFRSRDLSSQHISEGPPTNAERDGASTIVYPPMQLYRPIRESDSMSDLTANAKYPARDFFE